MLTITISLLFGLAAFTALAVVSSSLIAVSRRVRTIAAELAEIERRAGLTRARWALPRSQGVLPQAFAAA